MRCGGHKECIEKHANRLDFLICELIDENASKRSEELFAAKKCGLSAARWLLAVLQPGRADLIDYLWRLCRCRLPAPTLVAATFLRDAAAAAVGAGRPRGASQLRYPQRMDAALARSIKIT